MSNKKTKETMKLSYESDGKMGNNSKNKPKNNKSTEFFNITPGSE